MAHPSAGLATTTAVVPQRARWHWSRTGVKALVSAAIVALLLRRIPPAQVLEAATLTGLAGYVAVALGLVVFLLLGALRVYLTVTAFARVSFRPVAWLYCRSVALGAFTPGQVGELFGLTYFLKRRGIDMVDSLAITAVDRVTTLGTLVVLATAGLVAYVPYALNGPLVLVLTAGAAGVLTLFVRPWRKRVRAAVQQVAPRAVPFFEAFCRFFLSYPMRALANVLLGLARWACAAFMLLVIIEPQLPSPIDRSFVLLANAAARLVTYVPISINGIGVLELSAVELFKLGHIPAELTFAAFVVNRIVYYLFAAVMMLGLAWSDAVPRGGGDAAPAVEAGDTSRPAGSVRARDGRSTSLGLVDAAFGLGCCLVAVLAARRPFPDPDLGWHLAGGLWMLSTGQVPQQDPFGAHHAFWLCYSWLPELLYAAVYTLGGFVAVHLLEILTFVGVAVFAFIYVRRLSRTETDTTVGVARVSEWLTTAVLLSILLPVCSLRPHVLSWVFLGILILLADAPRPSVLGVFSLTLVWVNTHVYWILVPLVVFLTQVVFPPRASLRARLLGVIATIATAAIGFINPYGWQLFPGLHAMLFDQAVSTRLVFELAPLSVDNPVFQIYWGVLLGAALCARRVIARVGWARVLLFVLLAAAGARALKSLPLFAISAAPLLVRAVFPDLLTRLARVWAQNPMLVRTGHRLHRECQPVANARARRSRATSRARMMVAVAAGIVGVLALREAREQPFLRTPHRELFSIAEALQHVPRFRGVEDVGVLGDANYGGWLDLALWLAKPATASESRFRVAIDNRGLVAGEGRFDEYDRLRQMSGDWRAILRAWDIDVAILPTPAAMVDALRTGSPQADQPAWDLLNVGPVWTVLARP